MILSYEVIHVKVYETTEHCILVSELTRTLWTSSEALWASTFNFHKVSERYRQCVYLPFNLKTRIYKDVFDTKYRSYSESFVIRHTRLVCLITSSITSIIEWWICMHWYIYHLIKALCLKTVQDQYNSWYMKIEYTNYRRETWSS